MAVLEWEEAQEPLCHDIDTGGMHVEQASLLELTRSASISLGKVGRTSNTSSSDWFGSMCSWGVQACQNGRKAHFGITQ
ncbi:unnamed protein product [Sphagnum troendelagicum]|uniref:Uncharacterized protein n=1 Tax=Sphagnum troendelagicum TaxID=128251 RepID=A0ABP0TYC5_9BRYO